MGRLLRGREEWLQHRRRPRLQRRRRPIPAAAAIRTLAKMRFVGSLGGGGLQAPRLLLPPSPLFLLEEEE